VNLFFNGHVHDLSTAVTVYMEQSSVVSLKKTDKCLHYFSVTVRTCHPQPHSSASIITMVSENSAGFHSHCIQRKRTVVYIYEH